jgi:pyruvate carboxylase
VGAAGGIIEGALCYTGDVADPKRGPYTLEYFLDVARWGILSSHAPMHQQSYNM